MTESDYSQPTPEEEMSGDLPVDPRSDTPDPLERPGSDGTDEGVVDVEDEIEEGNPNPPGADVCAPVGGPRFGPPTTPYGATILRVGNAAR